MHMRKPYANAIILKTQCTLRWWNAIISLRNLKPVLQQYVRTDLAIINTHDISK